MLTKKSSEGKRARDPNWWGSLFEYFYPEISFGIIDKLAHQNDNVKQFITNLPSKCPFERQLWWGKVLVLYIPALCKFNPLFKQLMRLKVELLQEPQSKAQHLLDIGGLDFGEDLK